MLAKKYFFIVFVSLFLFMEMMPSVYAHCPLCTAAVGAAAVSAKYYGLDASIIGLLIGAFGASTGLWIGLKIRKEHFRFQFPIIVLLSFLLTVVPLLYISTDSIYFPILFMGTAGTLLNKVYWVNKMLLGSTFGGLITLVAFYFHLYIKKTKGRVLFPFQGVVITLVLLAISGLAFQLIFGA